MIKELKTAQEINPGTLYTLSDFLVVESETMENYLIELEKNSDIFIISKNTFYFDELKIPLMELKALIPSKELMCILKCHYKNKLFKEI